MFAPLLLAAASVGAFQIEVRDDPAGRFPLLAALRSADPPRLVGYTPSELDPRDPANHARLPTVSVRADLEALRPGFDGLILYGYHEADTPRIVELAARLNYTAVLLAVWDPRSADELDGVARLCELHADELNLAVVVGNEGLLFDRYSEEDLSLAAARLAKTLPAGVPTTTSEPVGLYERAFVREFGDFLLPNIHPVFDRPAAPPAEAAAYARAEAARLARQSGRPVILKETGVPHAGTPPAGGVTYTPEMQRDFWAAYVAPGLLNETDAGAGWVYHGAAFEAFDLPWKSEASGLPIERSWGLLNEAREPWPAFAVWRELR